MRRNAVFTALRLNIFKLDGNSEHNKFSPVSMYFRKDEWSANEMFEIMKEIAETSLRYYIF